MYRVVLGSLLLTMLATAVTAEAQAVETPSPEIGQSIIRSLDIVERKANIRVSPLINTATNQFEGFLRYPAEGTSFIPMVNFTAYFRDFFEGGETFTFGSQQGDTISAQMFDVNNLTTPIATWPGYTFYSSYTTGGVTLYNCWVGGGGYLCGANDIDVLWYRQMQCAHKGAYEMRFLYNGQVWTTARFYMSPQIEASRVPGDNLSPVNGDINNNYNQGSYGNQIGNFCRTLDATGKAIRHTTHACHNPLLANEQIATIAQLGCAMTDSAMILGYFGAFTHPDALNTWLSVITNPTEVPEKQKTRGYDASANVYLDMVARYAATRNISLRYRRLGQAFRALTLPEQQMICTFGPIMLHVKQDQHFVLTYGRDFDETTYLLHDPDGGTFRYLSSTTPKQYYNNVFTSSRAFEGKAQVFTTNYGMSIRLHSPAELLLTDPSGLRTGVDPLTNTTYTEAPNSRYDDISIGDLQDPTNAGIEEKELEIGNPVDGDYTLSVTGTDTGSYTLEFHGENTQGTLLQSEFPPIPTAPGVVNTFIVTMNLASGGGPTFTGGYDGGGQRPRDVNKFLSYGNPSASQTSVPTGTTSFPLIIFYGQTVVPSSFTATVGGVSITNLFHVAPGQAEVVNVPVKSGRNVIELSIMGNLPNRIATDTDRLVIQVP